jgi:low temperature requirement protein LtrA
VVAFVGSVAMWWIYFNIGAEQASQRISQSDNPGRLARLAYTYMHLPLVAGIIVAAVGDELVLAHPGGHTQFATAATVLGGPALYLVGNLMFKRATADRQALSHLVGLILLAAWAPFAATVPPLVFATGANLILVLVAVWETWSLGTLHAQAPAPKLPATEPS